MVLLESKGSKIGTPAPDFSLPSVDGKKYSLSDFKDQKVTVVMFICNHCPYVKAVEDRYIQLGKDYKDRGVQLVGICSNDASDYPDDSPENLLKRWQEKEYGFPYLVDESQEVAKAYDAVCTPEFYIYDADHRLAYHGRLDDNWENPSQVTRKEMWEAIDALLAGDAPNPKQNHSIGCSIKWKRG